MVAAATAVILNPRAGDLLVLNEAAKRAGFNFTRHGIVLALPPALTVEHDTEAMRLALSALGSAEGQPKADGSLLGLIQATRRVVQPR